MSDLKDFIVARSRPSVQLQRRSDGQTSNATDTVQVADGSW